MKARLHQKIIRLLAANLEPEENVHLGKTISRGSKRAGQLYELHVMEHLRKDHGDGLLEGPWISYQEEGMQRRLAQPDALIFDPFKGLIYLIECKLTHTTEAYWQMNNKYVPLLEFLFPSYKIARVEVYKNLSGFRWPIVNGVIDGLHQIELSGNYMWRLDV